VTEVRVTDSVVLGRHDLVLIAGPCVIESEAHALGLAHALAGMARRAGLPFIFKASFATGSRRFRGSE
jgi:2-dehydro-3-deoxyphosphooctonate aldolase (KDO 8-P synthase)